MNWGASVTRVRKQLAEACRELNDTRQKLAAVESEQKRAATER